MSFSVWSKSSARATFGSYSINACSWVRLTATLSTPGRLPSAFSIVPVHSEQCSPPMRARMRRRPGKLDGSSLQKRGVDSTVVARFMTVPHCVFGVFDNTRSLYAAQPNCQFFGPIGGLAADVLCCDGPMVNLGANSKVKRKLCNSFGMQWCKPEAHWGRLRVAAWQGQQLCRNSPEYELLLSWLHIPAEKGTELKGQALHQPPSGNQ